MLHIPMPLRRAAALLAALMLVLALAGCFGGPTLVKPGEAQPATALQGKAHSYTCSDELTLDFTADAAAAVPFNRFTLRYRLDAPLRGSIRYATQHGEAQEEFFLRAGEATFSQLLDGYLDGSTASALYSITLWPLAADSFTLELEQMQLDVQEVLPEVLTLENEHYRLGVKLSWGGGISLLEDLACPREDLGNLLNCHDTGRLIQQSFYGVVNDPDYHNGRYSSAVWPYNPVQGGDQYGHRSKIVAVSRQPDSITVVSRPLDWALDGVFTDAYYTNTYTLMEDVVQVDNTVIDFSGYSHPLASQELPAFYTVSALDTFAYYDGDAPWTDDALTLKRDLPFWGGDPEANFGLSPDNTETWCAWVDADGYGVGVFTPGVEQLCAGRYRYNGSTRDDADPTNYVAPLCSLQLPCFEPLSYSYLLGAGTLAQLRAAFTAHKDLIDNGALRQPLDADCDFSDITFEEEGDLVYFSAPNQTELTLQEGCVALRATTGTDSDPFINLRYARNPVPLAAGDYPYLVLTYRTGADNSGKADKLELFLATDRVREARGGCSVVQPLTADGEVHSLIVPVGEQSFWSGRINLIRLDYFTQAQQGDTFYLYRMALAPDAQSAEELAQQAEQAAAAQEGP